MDEAGRKERFRRNSCAGREVNIGLFVVAVLEVTDLDSPFLNQRPQAKVCAAEADAELALADVGILRDDAKDLPPAFIRQHVFWLVFK